MSRDRARTLVVLLLVCSILPVAYLASSLTLSAPGDRLREHRYSQAQDIPVEVKALLASLEQRMTPEDLER
ncbi:hypothetical protein MUP07_08890, partial [Candidatus Bathyarchaeota archaeon]|nr:hypothetical protein [Candidatus Bathyarchaeota archaeon]